MSAHIRRAASADAPIVALLGRVTFVETFGYLFRDRFKNDLRAYLDTTFDVAKIERSLGKPENIYWLALWEKLPVGYAKLKHPSPQPGRGIGHDLIDRVFTEAVVRAPVVWLDVLQENRGAVDFYRRHGFAVTGEHRFPIGSQQFLFHRMSRAP
jgi:GNAT superfamily N-acetyltransferase